MERPEDPRTQLAAERTLLAWIRTALALMGFGFVVARFGLFLRELTALNRLPADASRGISIWIGVTLVGMGVLVNLIAALEHAALLNILRIQRKRKTHLFGVGLAITLAILGVGMIVYLILVR